LQKKKTDRQKAVEEFMNELAAVPDDWIDLGIGRQQNAQTETFFRVIKWDAANLFRQQFGLPPNDFHVTIGFKSTDIHGVKKDESTLIAK